MHALIKEDFALRALSLNLKIKFSLKMVILTPNYQVNQIVTPIYIWRNHSLKAVVINLT